MFKSRNETKVLAIKMRPVHVSATRLLKVVCTHVRCNVSVVMQAKLHQARNEMREAAHYFRMNLERIEAENITGSDQLDALIYLAEYAKVTGRILIKVHASCC